MKSVIALATLLVAVQAMPQSGSATGSCTVPSGVPECGNKCFADPKLKCPSDPKEQEAYLCSSDASTILAACLVPACPQNLAELTGLQTKCAALNAGGSGSGSASSASGSAAAAASTPAATESGAAETGSASASASATAAVESGAVSSSAAAAAPTETGSATSGTSDNSTASGASSVPQPSQTGAASRVVAGGSLVLAAFAAVLAL